MTLSVPSFLAAATSASMPPRSARGGGRGRGPAAAAGAVGRAELLDGGEQAETAARAAVTAAREATVAPRRRARARVHREDVRRMRGTFHGAGPRPGGCREGRDGGDGRDQDRAPGVTTLGIAGVNVA